MYAEEDEAVFLGKSSGASHLQVSDETAKAIDGEVRAIIDDCYATAKALLEDNRDKLELMAEALLEYETIDAPQIEDIMAGRTPRPPADWDDNGPTAGFDGGDADGDEADGNDKPRPTGPIGDPAADV